MCPKCGYKLKHIYRGYCSEYKNRIVGESICETMGNILMVFRDFLLGLHYGYKLCCVIAYCRNTGAYASTIDGKEQIVCRKCLESELINIIPVQD